MGFRVSTASALSKSFTIKKQSNGKALKKRDQIKLNLVMPATMHIKLEFLKQKS